MQFKKGQSGNPGGRPKTAKGLRAELEKRYGVNAKALVDRLDLLSQNANDRVALEAVKVLLAYHSGPAAVQDEPGRDIKPLTVVVTHAP